jgi:uncharacterized protein (UPF0335 family)
MTSNTHISVYARELAGHLREIASTQEIIKDLIASAKDAGINVKALRKVAREMVMDSDKRQKLYDDEDQLALFRDELGLTGPRMLMRAAE